MIKRQSKTMIKRQSQATVEVTGSKVRTGNMIENQSASVKPSEIKAMDMVKVEVGTLACCREHDQSLETDMLVSYVLWRRHTYWPATSGSPLYLFVHAKDLIESEVRRSYIY
jgi:hypothetical protein